MCYTNYQNKFIIVFKSIKLINIKINDEEEYIMGLLMYEAKPSILIDK